MDTSAKEMLNLRIPDTKHTGNLGHCKKKLNLIIIGKEAGEERGQRFRKNFNNIIEEKYSKIKEMPIKV